MTPRVISKKENISSTYHFELVKVNEMTSTQYKFNPFQTEIDYCMKKEYLSQTWLRGSLRYCFLPFWVQETIYEKGPLEFSFPVLFQTL